MTKAEAAEQAWADLRREVDRAVGELEARDRAGGWQTISAFAADALHFAVFRTGIAVVVNDPEPEPEPPGQYL